MKNGLGRYRTVLLMVVAVCAMVAASLYIPPKAERDVAALVDCQRRCHPKDAVMKGRKVVPNDNLDIRRNQENFATCMCR